MSKAHELERLVVRLTGDGSGYISMMNAAIAKTKIAGEKIKAVGRHLQMMGGIMTVGVTLPILGVATALVKAGSSAETTRVQFETMLGRDKGRGMLKTIREFSSATPFNFPELAGATKMMLGFGMAQDEVMGSLKMLGDVSAATGKDLGELTRIYSQIRGIGKLQTEDFNQLADAGFPVKEIAKDMGMSIGKLREEMAAGNVSFKAVEGTFRRLTSEGGKFYNMMGNLSKTTTGRLSTLMDKIGEAARMFGDILLPMVNVAIDKIMEWVGRIQALSTEVKTTILWVGGLVAAIGPLITAVGTAVAFVGTFLTVLSAMGTSILGIVATAMAFASTIGLWVGIIGAAIVLIKMLTDYVHGDGSFVSAIVAAGKAVQNFGLYMVGWLANIRDNWGLLTEWLRENWFNMLKDMLRAYTHFGTNTISNVKTALHTIVRLWFYGVGRIAGKIEQVFSIDFPNLIFKGLQKAGGFLKTFTTKIGDMWEAIKGGRFLKAKGVGDSLVSWFTDVGEQMNKDFARGKNEQSFMGGAAEIMKEQHAKMKLPLEGFKSSMTDLPEFMTEVFKEAEKTVPKPGKDEKEVIRQATAATGGPTATDNQFKTMSLNRFSISPVAPYAKDKKQEVTDKGVMGKMDELIQVQTNQKNTAVMAQ